MKSINTEVETSVSNFVHKWFCDLDHLKEADIFLQHLSPDFIFDIYGSKLHGHEGFLSVYAGMCQPSRSYSKHTASDISIKSTGKPNAYKIDFLIRLDTFIDTTQIGRSESKEQWFVHIDEQNHITIDSYAIIDL